MNLKDFLVVEEEEEEKKKRKITHGVALKSACVGVARKIDVPAAVMARPTCLYLTLVGPVT